MESYDFKIIQFNKGGDKAKSKILMGVLKGPVLCILIILALCFASAFASIYLIKGSDFDYNPIMFYICLALYSTIIIAISLWAGSISVKANTPFNYYVIKDNRFYIINTRTRAFQDIIRYRYGIQVKRRILYLGRTRIYLSIFSEADMVKKLIDRDIVNEMIIKEYIDLDLFEVDEIARYRDSGNMLKIVYKPAHTLDGMMNSTFKVCLDKDEFTGADRLEDILYRYTDGN